MRKLFAKECKLAASPLSFVFVAAAFLTFLPGYPILLSAFFTTLGIFYSFQTMRENNDIPYSMLLPVAKTDIVKGKFLFVLFLEGCSFLLMVIFTLIRMLFCRDVPAYTANALMCANLSFLGFALLLFGLFNLVFVGGFFRTAYYYGKPFLVYCVLTLFVIAAAEALHHFPGMGIVNAFGFQPFLPQGAILCVGVLLFTLLTIIGWKKSQRNFEKTDL